MLSALAAAATTIALAGVAGAIVAAASRVPQLVPIRVRARNRRPRR